MQLTNFLFYFCKGITSYRTKILYVPQRPSLLSGSPQDFLTAITSLSVHKSKPQSPEAIQGSPTEPPTYIERAYQVGEAWGIDRELWTRTWGNLSGGEAQRILLASAVALDTAEVLLLDGECKRTTESLLINSITFMKQNPRPLSTRKRSP
jgi:ABC-type Mn2+/Zn2+ transport system ATPase subunit